MCHSLAEARHGRTLGDGLKITFSFLPTILLNALCSMLNCMCAPGSPRPFPARVLFQVRVSTDVIVADSTDSVHIMRYTLLFPFSPHWAVGSCLRAGGIIIIKIINIVRARVAASEQDGQAYEGWLRGFDVPLSGLGSSVA